MIACQAHRHKLYNVAICLINDGDFYVKYSKNALKNTAYNRRAAILTARHNGVYDDSLGPDDREHVRRYIDNYWNLPEAQKDATSSRDNMAFFELDPGVPFEAALAAYQAGDYANKVRSSTAPHVPKMDGSNRPAFPSPTETPKENIMTSIIKIETKTFANGVDIATMTDSAIYDLIASQEKKIKELEAIITKPKKLVKEIADRQDGIKALVAYLDSKA